MSMNDELDDGLTPEERAALQEEEGAGETNDQQQEDGAQKPADGLNEDEQREAEAAAAADADAAKQAAESAVAESDTADAEKAEAQQQPAPILVAPPTDGAEARLKEIADQKEALLNQFDEGDLTAREYQQKLDQLSRDERKIEFEIHEAQLATKLEQQRLQNEWSATCNAFVEANPVYKEMPWAYMQLDAKVKELASKPETANWTGQKFLDEAHKELKEQYKFPESQQTKRKTNERELPPNLAKVPAAEVEDTNGGKFAVLDRLANNDPLAYEETLAKMSDAERQAYLAS